MATRDQKMRAALLLGKGWSRKAVSAELGVDPSTVSRWRRDPSFEQVVQGARGQVLDGRPGIRAVLEDALVARRSNGEPDYAARLKAAQLLLTAPEEEPEQRPPEVRIYVDRLGKETKVRREPAPDPRRGGTGAQGCVACLLG